MNGMLWTLTIVLAVVFLVTGFVKIFRYDIAKARLSWVKDVPRPLVVVIGILEILGALGLILPPLTGFYVDLMPVAAIGLAVLMFTAITFHSMRREFDEVNLNVLLLLLAGFLAYGRLYLAPLN